jgi:hypothetical protein
LWIQRYIIFFLLLFICAYKRYIIKGNTFSALCIQLSLKMKHLKTTNNFIITIALLIRSCFSKQNATIIFCSCKSSISLETYAKFEVIYECVCVCVCIHCRSNEKQANRIGIVKKCTTLMSKWLSGVLREQGKFYLVMEPRQLKIIYIYISKYN